MSRLTDLIAQAKRADAQLGANLETEIKALSDRRAFGLNFERHQPEAFELFQRPVRRGDKVRVLPARGTVDAADQRLWSVSSTSTTDGIRVAELTSVATSDDDKRVVPVAELVGVAEYRDVIHPGLRSTGRVELGGDAPFHTVLNAENYHALKTLTFTHRGRVDCIYIDPPYNTGARDWIYNNDYVEGDDQYRHSKWLAFMERRLVFARQLLNPAGSVLIVTIDEKEYLRLGLLLEQIFPDARIQMVTIVINPSGTSRDLLSRVEEFAFFVFAGDAVPARVADNLLTGTADAPPDTDLAWESLLRRGNSWYRTSRPNLCYPVLIDSQTGQIAGVGNPFAGDDESTRAGEQDGYFAAWPVRTDGRLGIWRKDGKGLLALARRGYAYATSPDPKRGTWSLKYLMSGTVAAIEAGTVEVTRSGHRGQVEGHRLHSDAIAKTVWNRPQHNAGMHGSVMLRQLTPGHRFPFPKSLYAVEDAIRVAVADKPDAVVLDFFAGSGTTAHAVMRLNRADGGQRTSISVTNNEVSADGQQTLRERGLRPGDSEWEALGICQHVTQPRVRAAVTGRTPTGEPVTGDYRYNGEYPMAEGLPANIEFFDLTYESPVAVQHNLAFTRIAPLLWMRAGSQGERIDELPGTGWAVADTYGLLIDLDRAVDFCVRVSLRQRLRIAYVVTDDDARFQAVARRLPRTVDPIRLWESYLSNFQFVNGD